MSNKKRRFARIATGVLTVLLLLWSGGLYTLSFMPWWIPVLIGIAFAVVTISAGMKMWRSVLNVNGRIALILIHVLVAGSIGAFAVVGGNYYGAPESSARDVDAIVIGKHSEKRNRYRTLRRRRVIGVFPLCTCRRIPGYQLRATLHRVGTMPRQQLADNGR